MARGIGSENNQLPSRLPVPGEGRHQPGSRGHGFSVRKLHQVSLPGKVAFARQSVDEIFRALDPFACASELFPQVLSPFRSAIFLAAPDKTDLRSSDVFEQKPDFLGGCFPSEQRSSAEEARCKIMERAHRMGSFVRHPLRGCFRSAPDTSKRGSRRTLDLKARSHS